MNDRCREIREYLAEWAGSANPLDESIEAHLQACEECRSTRIAEERLNTVFEAAVAPEDRDLQRRVMDNIRGLENRRRFLAVFPVAASVMMVLVGVALLGGVPGGAAARTSVSSLIAGGWVSLVSSISSALTAWRGAAVGVSRFVAAPQVLASITVAVILMIGIAMVIRRWRRPGRWSGQS